MSLEETYEICRELMLDSLDVVKEVEKYRQDFKPAKVRTILLAESHAHTPEGDLSQLLKKQYRHSDGSRCRKVRFVYCLGSGESQVLETQLPALHRPSQFWRILYSCLNRISTNSDFKPFDGVPTEERLSQKTILLDDLKSKGIWLVDASIVGINVLDREARREIMKACWDGFIGRNLEELEDLQRVLVIGKNVNESLSQRLRGLEVRVKQVPQPQARIKGGYLKYYREVFDFCH